MQLPTRSLVVAALSPICPMDHPSFPPRQNSFGYKQKTLNSTANSTRIFTSFQAWPGGSQDDSPSERHLSEGASPGVPSQTAPSMELLSAWCRPQLQRECSGRGLYSGPYPPAVFRSPHYTCHCIQAAGLVFSLGRAVLTLWLRVEFSSELSS